MNESSHGNLKSYVIGFVLSIVLTLVAYLIVVNDVWSRSVILTAIILLAILQLFVQLIYFLHVGRESKPRWNLIALSFAALVVGIVVIGSIWIMNNLNYSHEHGHEASAEKDSQYIIKDELIKH
ncbi:MAG: cytochrome o ubiquinol oxidase subunit IV [Patescibacteria group bacterium]